MTYLKLSEAARQVGVSRPTIYKYAAEGRISVTRDRLGHKQVQLSELLRVFGELSPETEKTVKTDNATDAFSSMRQSQKTTETSSLSALLVELERTKAQLESKAMETALLRERVDELKARERYNQEERSRLMAMLEQSQRLLAAPTPAPRAPARKKAAVSAPTPAAAHVAPSRASSRKKAAAPAPAPAPVPLTLARAPVRKKAAHPVLVPAAPAKVATSSKASIAKPRKR